MADTHKYDPNDNIPKMPLQGKKGDDISGDSVKEQQNLAAEMIRNKLKTIHGDAPSASKELEEIKHENRHYSKHQKYILELQQSGKSQVEIQTDWHNYYMSLPDEEKNRVWEEFYDANKPITKVSHAVKPNYTAGPDLESEQPTKRDFNEKFVSIEETPPEEKKTPAQLKKDLLRNVKVKSRQNNKWYQRFSSLAFGIGVGSLVLLIFLFSFFNDRFIAPFITPSRDVSAQSLISDPNGTVGPDPLIIIPKINVEIPVIYSVPTTDENQIENNLEDGVVHYPTTAYPGQLGNGAIFGHSSNNILNPGKYKFAFVLLHDLQIGDTFTLNYQGKAYVYQIFQKQIVAPTDVGVLNDISGHPATFTLITCDPPGTSINRLVVVGDQISPSPSTNIAGTNQNNAPKPTTLPSNSPSLWSRLTDWL